MAARLPIARLVTQPDKEVLAIVWSHDQWRCEYCRTANQMWLVLHYGPDVALQRRVANAAEMRDTARIWKAAIRGLLPHILLPTLPSVRARRQISDRRVATRGGRRRVDGDKVDADNDEQ